MKQFLKIHPSDNVAVALADACAGADCLGVTLRADVARGHKAALRRIEAGESVIKYGFPIGHATQPIEAGEWVHSHNLSTSLSDNLQYAYEPVASKAAHIGACPQVMGYERANGDMGVRNELWIIPTVGCVNAQAKAIAQELQASGPLPGVDAVKALTHPYGCSQLGCDHAATRAALIALAKHPNAGGVLLLGLGCENNQLPVLREMMGDYDADRVRFLVAQEVADEVAEGVAICQQLAQAMSRDIRKPMPLSKLRVGLKCGGSDGLSGITANPLVGAVSDRIIACGGSTVLTEVPEMFGAETLLMNRAVSHEVFADIVSLINNFKDYFRAYGQPIYENPSPGNKAGGVTTLEEKSLGCVQKGGTMPVTNVLPYATPAIKPGLNLLNAPGNDLVASTALALSGCQLVLFTTGRGTPFGTFVPTMKIATNTPLAQRKPQWIDFNAGAIAEDASIDEKASELLLKIAAVASGERTRNEEAGASEIAIFKSGVTL